MITQEQIIKVHQQNPTWSVTQIAKHLNCRPGQVGTVAIRKRLKLPRMPRTRRTSATIIELGRACKKANVSLQDIAAIVGERGNVSEQRTA